MSFLQFQKENNVNSITEEIENGIKIVERNVNIIFEILVEYDKILETKEK